MSSRTWVSNTRNFVFGDKQGLRAKFFDEEWEPAQFEILPYSEAVRAARERHHLGKTLTRRELPEALAVWNPIQFGKVGALFYGGPFYAVREPLAEVLSRFDLGSGGLVPVPVLQADLSTPVEGRYFMLNFGAEKNSICVNESINLKKHYVEKNTGKTVWMPRFCLSDGDLVVSSAALSGPDIWHEPAIGRAIFFSDQLAHAVKLAVPDFDFELCECRCVTA